jgi:WD40 repeat protein
VAGFAGYGAWTARSERIAAEGKTKEATERLDQVTKEQAVRQAEAEQKVVMANRNVDRAKAQEKAAKLKEEGAKVQYQRAQQQTQRAEQQVAIANGTLERVNQEKEVATVAKAEAEMAKVAAENQLVVAQKSAEEAIGQQEIAIAEKHQAEAEVQVAQNTLAEAKQVTQIQRSSSLAISQIESQPMLALVNALESGQQLQTLVKQKAKNKGAVLINQKLALSDYPAFSPIYALNQILSTIPVRKIPTHQDAVLRMSWSEDGETLATGGWDGSVKLWTKTGGLLKILDAHKDKVLSLEWSVDGKILATGGEDGKVKLWTPTGELLKILDSHKARVSSTRWSRDGQILATASDQDGYVKLWTSIGNPISTFSTHEAGVGSMSWIGDEQTLGTISEEQNDLTRGVVKLWAGNGKLVKTLNLPDHSIKELSWSKTDKSLTTIGMPLSDGTVRLWTRDGKLVKLFKSSGISVITQASWSSDGQTLATGEANGSITLWTRDGNLVRTFQAQHQGQILSMDWNKDGRTLATGGSDGSVNLLATTSERRAVFSGITQGKKINMMSLAEDGQTLAINSDEDENIILLNTGALLKTFKTQKQDEINQLKIKVIKRFGTGFFVNSMSWNSNSQILTTYGNPTTKLWSRAGNAISTLDSSKKSTPFIGKWQSWSHDGEILATGLDDGTVKLESRTGELIKIFNAYQYTLDRMELHVDSVSWSPDGQILATINEIGQGKLWSRTGELIRTFDTEVLSPVMTWSADAQILFLGGVRGISLLATEDLDALLDRGCSWASSYLIGTPSTLQTLTACQTPARLRAASVNLFNDSKILAREGKIEAAIQGFTTAKQWDSSFMFDPVAKAKELAKAAKSK